MTDEIDWYIKEGEKDVSATDLMLEALAKLTISTFDELVRHSGKMEAIAAVRPYRKQSAHVLVDGMRKMLNIQSNGPDAMLFAHAFGSLTAGISPDDIQGEVKEKGSIGITRNCPFGAVGYPELCVSVSHLYTEYEAEVINPEYECVWTHHESNGDSYCRYVFKKKSDPLSVVDDLGKTLMVLPKFEVPEKQLQASRVWALSGWSYAHISAFNDLHGEKKTKDTMGPVAMITGHQIGVRLAKENPKLTNSVESVGKLVRAMQNSLGQRDNFVVVSESEVSNEITDCSMFLVQNPSCGIRFEPFFKAMVSAINPDFEFSYDRMVTKGDKTCRWSIKRKFLTNEVVASQ